MRSSISTENEDLLPNSSFLNKCRREEPKSHVPIKLLYEDINESKNNIMSWYNAIVIEKIKTGSNINKFIVLLE